AQLRDWMARAGWEALVNRRGPTFRKLPPERQSDLDAQRACDLLKEFPSAIKRPVVVAGAQLLVGFDAALYAKVLAK
ncbi:MAG: arsenate reductase, partial [Rhodocyclaceae bacterium]|nr:arsenate reductase [Rhodocyclaceae bacterium]